DDEVGDPERDDDERDRQDRQDRLDEEVHDGEHDRREQQHAERVAVGHVVEDRARHPQRGEIADEAKDKIADHRSKRRTSCHVPGSTTAPIAAFTSPPTMKIVKPLWIVQPHVSPTAIFSPTNPNAKISNCPPTKARNARTGLRSAPCSAIQPMNPAAKMKPMM